MLIRTKLCYFVAIKMLKRFPIKKKDFRFFCQYLLFFGLLYLLENSDMTSIFTMLAGGALFYFQEEGVGSVIGLDEAIF